MPPLTFYLQSKKRQNNEDDCVKARINHSIYVNRIVSAHEDYSGLAVKAKTARKQVTPKIVFQDEV